MEEKIFEIPIEQEVQSSYLDYAMSVIVSRALPDVRDGLKPVHRRILYSMWKLGLKSTAKFRKSATVVGEVLGKYHPHGDASVYDALVRLAQDFSLRYPLILGQGNFGSIDGDPQAAMRYTEAKLSKIAEEMLYDIEKDTVNFRDNYDGTQKEPEVLPSKLPNLILNGTMGIAVGMATNIPPHNLNEVCDAIIYLIDNKDATVEDLMNFIKGPDFPTGGIIFNQEDIKNVYLTGRGGIIIRARVEIEDTPKGARILVTEIPYQVNKSQLLEKIANLVKEKKIEGIKELKDASDKEGLRIIIGLKKEANPQKILNLLYKYTQMQTVFYNNFVALVEGIQPKVLNLKGLLEEYINHRKEVIVRRTKYDLKVAEHREHILEGLKKALDIIDKVIDTIRSSKNREEAKVNLMKKFKFTEIQTDAILDMRLHQLANLERKKVLDELKEKKNLIKTLKEILSSEKKVLEIIKEDLEYLKKNYGDERRTKIIKSKPEEISEEDLIFDEETIILVTNNGYIKRVSPKVFKSQARGGKGVKGVEVHEGDFVKEVIFSKSKNDILFFTSKGKVYKTKVFNIPEGSRISKGKFIANILNISLDEKISAIISLDRAKKIDYLFMVTKNGIVKKVKLEEFRNIRSTGIIAINLKQGDDLKFVIPTSKESIICLVTKNGQSICFRQKDVRAMGRNAAGVIGIKLQKGDEVIGIGECKENQIKDAEILTVTEKGYGKRTKLSEYTIQKRGGKGIRACKINQKTGNAIYSIIIVKDKLKELEGDLILVSGAGKVIRVHLDSIPILSRSTIGVKIMRLEVDKITSVTLV